MYHLWGKLQTRGQYTKSLQRGMLSRFENTESKEIQGKEKNLFRKKTLLLL